MRRSRSSPQGSTEKSSKGLVRKTEDNLAQSRKGGSWRLCARLLLVHLSVPYFSVELFCVLCVLSRQSRYPRLVGNLPFFVRKAPPLAAFAPLLAGQKPRFVSPWGAVGGAWARVGRWKAPRVWKMETQAEHDDTTKRKFPTRVRKFHSRQWKFQTQAGNVNLASERLPARVAKFHSRVAILET